MNMPLHDQKPRNQGFHNMRLEKCQDTCIVKIQASLEENMYPLGRNISAGTADRKQLYKGNSSLYIILQMTPTEKQFSLNPLGWRIGTPGLLEHSDRWERFCQQLTSLEAITAYSVPSIRMVAYVMYVFSNLILTLKLERNPTLCEKKEKLPRTPCRSFPLPSKEVWAQD